MIKYNSYYVHYDSQNLNLYIFFSLKNYVYQRFKILVIKIILYF